MRSCKLLIDRDEIQNKILELSELISKDYMDDDIVIICVLKGAFIFASDLIKNLYFRNCVIDFVKVSSYGDNTTSSGTITLTKDIEIDIKDKQVVIVEDILDTGYTLNYLINKFSERKPKSIKTCVLLNKKERRKVNIEADYIGFDIENKFVIGYGLDYNESFRNLVDIYEVSVDLC